GGGVGGGGGRREVSRVRARKGGALFAYLAFYGDRPPHPREALADLFWPDADAETGRHNLSAELTPLRRLLETPGLPPGSVLQADRLTVRLNPAAVATDAQRFEDAARRALEGSLPPAERLALLREAADAYQGRLLPGYYEEWIEAEARRVDSRALQVLLAAVPLLLESGAPEEAVEFAYRATALDSLSEEALAALVRALTAAGQPGQ